MFPIETCSYDSRSRLVFLNVFVAGVAPEVLSVAPAVLWCAGAGSATTFGFDKLKVYSLKNNT